MGRIAYSSAQKAEAVSLGSVIGADAAAKRLGMQARTIRGWMARAGKRPADAIASADWASLGELARTQVQADLVSGRVKPKDAAVIAAIADRNAVKVQEASPESAVAAADAFFDWLTSDDVIGSLGLTLTEPSQDDDAQAGYALQRELMRRANEEPGSPRRNAMLAWFSGRPEFPAGDVLEWAQDQTRAMLAEHVSLPGLLAWETAQREARDKAMFDQLALNRLRAAEAQRAALDATTQAILEEAERWLASQAKA